MEGMSSLKPLRQSVLNTLLVAQPEERITKEITDWELVAHPVPSTTLDGRLRKGNTYLDHSALGVSLESGLMEGVSCLEPLEQSVLNKLLVARPEAGITKETTDWEPVAHPVLSTTLDGRLREGNTYLEHSALGVSLDSGLMEGMSRLELFELSVLNTRSVAQPGDGIMKEFADWDAVAEPVPDINLDGRPMEGTTYLEPSALGVSLDSGLIKGMSRPEPLEQSVLGMLLVAQPVEVRLWHRIFAIGCAVVSAGALDRRPMEGITAPDNGLQVLEPFEHSVLDHADPATVGPFEHSVLDMEMRHDNLDSSDEPQFGSNRRQSSLELEDAIRREVLRSLLMGRVSACDRNGLLLSPENACLGDKEMSLDKVRSEGLQQWNMDKDVEFQFETFKGLPMYYGGDMYDSEYSEEYDPLEMARAACVEDYDFDVSEGMELMTYTRLRPDGGEARIINTVDMVPMCQTVSCVTRSEPDVSSDTSGTEPSGVIEGSDIEACSISNVGSSVDNSLCMSEQDSLSYVDVASIGDFDGEDSDEDIGFNSDEGSVAELEWYTWDEACALELHNASGVFPPNSTVFHLAVNIEDTVYNMEEAPVLEPLKHLNCVLTDHVDIDIFWRTVFRWVARLSCWPTFIEEDCSRLFRSLGWMCVLDVNVGQTDVPTGSPGDGPPEEFATLADVAGRRRNVAVPLGHSDGKVFTTEWSYGNGIFSRHGTGHSYEFSPDGCYPG